MRIFLVVLICIFLISGCDAPQPKIIDSESNTTEVITYMTIPNNQEHEYDPEPMTDFKSSSNINNYDKIRIYTEYDTYSIGEETIKCFITNDNPGRGFYAYDTVGIEYWKNEEWNRLPYEYDNPDWHGKYILFTATNNPDIKAVGAVFFSPRYLGVEYKPGKYRIIVFVGPNKYYDEFEVIDDGATTRDFSIFDDNASD